MFYGRSFFVLYNFAYNKFRETKTTDLICNCFIPTYSEYATGRRSTEKSWAVARKKFGTKNVENKKIRVREPKSTKKVRAAVINPLIGLLLFNRALSVGFLFDDLLFQSGGSNNQWTDPPIAFFPNVKSRPDLSQDQGRSWTNRFRCKNRSGDFMTL